MNSPSILYTFAWFAFDCYIIIPCLSNGNSSFFIKTLFPKVEIKAAKNLTRAQITQFFSGIILSSGVLIMGSACDTQSSRFSLACLHVYGYGLIALFMAFAKRKYKSK